MTNKNKNYRIETNLLLPYFLKLRSFCLAEVFFTNSCIVCSETFKLFGVASLKKNEILLYKIISKNTGPNISPYFRFENAFRVIIDYPSFCLEYRLNVATYIAQTPKQKANSQSSFFSECF